MIAVTVISLFSCKESSTVKIGKQEWAVENLNVFTFRNGDSIFFAKSCEEFREVSNKGLPACCYCFSCTSLQCILPVPVVS